MMYKIGFTLFLLISMPLFGYSEEKDKKEETTEDIQVEPTIEDQGFIDYGSLSISIGYKLARNKKQIIYKISNNTNKSIDRLFGQIYKIERDETGRVTKNVLANNPNTSGTLISKYPHKSSTLGTWRFTLKEKLPQQNAKYFLRVSNRSIYYVPLEIRESRVIKIEKEEEIPPVEF